METGLEGRVVLITGASGGIGSAIARHFAAEGAKLVLHYRSSRPNIDSLVRTSKSGNAMSVEADLTQESQVGRIFAQVLKRFGRVDTLIANAGSWESHDVPLNKMSLRQWEDTFDSVITTAFLSLREFSRVVARQRRGKAGLIASTAAVFGEAGHADYAPAQSAMAFGLPRSTTSEIAQ